MRASGAARTATSLVACLGIGVAVAPSAPVSGQTPRAVGVPSAASSGVPTGFGYVAQRAYPHQTMVAASVRIPVGSAHDPEGAGGTAWLLGNVRVDQAAERIDPSRGVVRVSVQRGHTVFDVLALPDAWPEVWAVAEDVIFTAAIPSETFSARRDALLRGLRFEDGSPVQDFTREAAGLRAPLGSPWARPVRGTPTTVGQLDASDLLRFARSHYDRARSAVAVVGPVADAQTLVQAVSPERQDVAWLVGDRVSLRQEVTSAWISVAYPVPATVGRTALEMVAYLLDEALDPTPPRPDQFGVRVRLEETQGGVVLLVEAAVSPEAVAEWEARIRTAVDELAREELRRDFFRWSRRRFRSRRILQESAPEATAARMTADLLRTGSVRDLQEELWSLSPRSLVEAARSLGEPRIFLLEADLGS